ncbi:MAG: PQQ-binding-like beta-propeller repeat protein [Anaerolineales bacterium]|nr:PQQ-binding-like beta-propeller repeat protein [Anaerolineales bacterium]
MSFKSKTVIALLALLAISFSAFAADFLMGNLDRSGSRSIPAEAQADLSKSNVEEHGLQVRWTSATDSWVAGAAVTFGKMVYVGDAAGFMYAFDREDGSLLWKTCVEDVCPGPTPFFSGIIGSPLVKGEKVYVGTLSGSLVALDAKTGALLWTHTPAVAPPVDSVWGGPISVRNMIIYALAPNDEFGIGIFGRGAVLAVDAKSGDEVWRSVLISDADFAAGSSGAAVWNTTPTYSPELDLIFVGTGQDTNPAGSDVGSDTFFAINASDGAIAWQTQVRTGDTWSVVLPFDPLNPTDTDIGDSPAVFKMNGQLMVAAGDKRGIFWVLDATTGNILNNGGAGLDLFGGVLPGPGLTGGFNLDAGYVKNGDDVKHFAVFADQTTSLQAILDDDVNFPDDVCTFQTTCPIFPDTGNLVILEGDGSAEVCRFIAPDTELFSPIHVGGMVIVRGAQDGTLYAVDFDDCSLISSLPLPSGFSLGANLSISKGVIYTGGGFFGAPGLTAIEVAD